VGRNRTRSFWAGTSDDAGAVAPTLNNAVVATQDKGVSSEPRSLPHLAFGIRHSMDLLALVLLGVTVLESPTHHVQGIDVENGILWVTSVDRAARKGYLARFDLASGRRLAAVEVQDGERYHPGGIQLDGDAVWVPVAEYRRESSTWMQKRDKHTLALIEQFEVRDHIGCVAVADDVLWGGNWDSLRLYRWRKDGTPVDVRDNPTDTRYQDMKWLEGVLVASGLRTRTEGAIEWLDADDLRVVRRITTGATDRGVLFTHEGMTVLQQTLYLLPEDDPSRLFRFALSR
jgi:hypothetical protein